MDFNKLVKEANKNAPPMFHPIHERDEGAWFPGNEAASVASIISHTWEDIQCLFEIRKKCNNNYENKLLFKYIVIELRSIIKQLENLQSIIFKLISSIQDKDSTHGYISKDEASNIKSLFKEYHDVKKLFDKDVIEIRNNIGAHRGDEPWNYIMDLWDKLEPETFKPLFIVIPKLFDSIVKLDIYDWTRTPKKGSIEICCSGLNKP